MKKTKFTEAQIVFALKQAETGVAVAEVCLVGQGGPATPEDGYQFHCGSEATAPAARLLQLESDRRSERSLAA